MATKMRHIRGVLQNVSSQRVVYKPYGYSLSFDNLLGSGEAVVVEFDIPDKDILETGSNYVVVGLDGLKSILKVTADAIDSLNNDYLKSIS